MADSGAAQRVSAASLLLLLLLRLAMIIPVMMMMMMMMMLCILIFIIHTIKKYILFRNCFTIMESIQVAVSVLILFLVNLNVIWYFKTAFNFV